MPSQSSTPSFVLREAYRLMRARFGHQHWWPAETPFEVCVGAILTQNTAWTNVERALAHLQSAGLLAPARLHALTVEELAKLIRPAGCHGVKARRLRAFLEVLVGEFHGRLEELFAGETAVVRERLLAIHGIGPETADCLLLYAGGHPSFVVDAYTRRILARHGWCVEHASYGAVQSLCAASLGEKHQGDVLNLWQDYHAQLVQVGKQHCRVRIPDCAACPLRDLLPPGGALKLRLARP